MKPYEYDKFLARSFSASPQDLVLLQELTEQTRSSKSQVIRQSLIVYKKFLTQQAELQLSA